MVTSLHAPRAGETLYNGIALPDEWPPKVTELTREPPVVPPYLKTPPAVIPIDVGRQLFVDDFLVESTTLARTHHLAQYHPANPVLTPDKPWEGVGPGANTRRVGAGVFSDGVWYDPADKLFKAWYWGGSLPRAQLGYTTCLALSRDGVHWDKPAFDVIPGTNIVKADEDGLRRNSSTVWLDQADPDPARRFKMFRVLTRETTVEKAVSIKHGIRIDFSPDGIHWTTAGDSDPTGDRSTVFYNAFRNVWVFGIRDGDKLVSRCRAYCENADPLKAARWTDSSGKRVRQLWVGADSLDPAREDLELRRVPERPWDLVPSQLYNLDCVAYESVMLGMFSIWRGHPLKGQRPKINEVCVGFSRDGFHWSRPDRRAFCPVSEDKDAWNWGNVQSAGGGCLIVGDKLYFYVTAANRKLPAGTGLDATYTGLATLRRDGFTSMDAGDTEGTLTTRPVRFSGRYLFVNADSAKGKLAVEVLDAEGKTIPPFTQENCVAVSANSTLQAVTWRGVADLAAVAGEPVRFRFHLSSGALYAFWVSRDPSGASAGYVAAGGPGFAGCTDTVGKASYATP